MTAVLYFNIQDSKGDVSRVEIPLGNVLAASMVQLPALVPVVAELIQPLVGGGLVSAGFNVEVDVSAGWGIVAALGADVQEKAEFVFNSVGGFFKRLNIPTVLESIFNPGSAEVDLGNVDVDNFLEFMTDGATVSAVHFEPTDIRNADLISVQSATENWGKRRR